MRALLIPLLLCVLAGAAGAGLVLWLRRRMPGATGADLDRVLDAIGAARCVAATNLLRRLGERADSAAIARLWDRLELPLLQALPDCPPDFKVDLINALDACARACRVVEVSRRVMTMRNSLLA